MFEDEDYHHITFSFREAQDGVVSTVERRLSEKHSYFEIMDEFRWFLQNMGYSFVHNVAALDEHGRELYRTENL